MYISVVYLLPFLFQLVFSLPHPLSERSVSNGPVIGSNFPDPAFIQQKGTYWAFSTTSGGKNVPIAKSSDFKKWSIINRDALPKENLPAWTTGNIWAPDVIKLVWLPYAQASTCGLILTIIQPNGRFVLYYSATTKKDTSKHCIGAATSLRVDGPYVSDSDEPLACDLPYGLYPLLSPPLRC